MCCWARAEGATRAGGAVAFSSSLISALTANLPASASLPSQIRGLLFVKPLSRTRKRSTARLQKPSTLRRRGHGPLEERLDVKLERRRRVVELVRLEHARVQDTQAPNLDVLDPLDLLRRLVRLVPGLLGRTDHD